MHAFTVCDTVADKFSFKSLNQRCWPTVTITKIPSWCIIRVDDHLMRQLYTSMTKTSELWYHLFYTKKVKLKAISLPHCRKFPSSACLQSNLATINSISIISHIQKAGDGKLKWKNRHSNNATLVICWMVTTSTQVLIIILWLMSLGVYITCRLQNYDNHEADHSINEQQD